MEFELIGIDLTIYPNNYLLEDILEEEDCYNDLIINNDNNDDYDNNDDDYNYDKNPF